MSLILSLLQVKPAPMYILDEIDSALDLSHTQHIGQLFRSRFKGSQFIVVSLKEGLFTNANVLFKARFRDGTSVVEVWRGVSPFRANLTDSTVPLSVPPSDQLQRCMTLIRRMIQKVVDEADDEYCHIWMYLLSSQCTCSLFGITIVFPHQYTCRWSMGYREADLGRMVLPSSPSWSGRLIPSLASIHEASGRMEAPRLFTTPDDKLHQTSTCSIQSCKFQGNKEWMRPARDTEMVV